MNGTFWKNILVILIFFAVCSCGEEAIAPSEPLAGVTDVLLRDKDNKGDASDFVVNFVKQTSLEPIAGYKLFLLKSSDTSAFSAHGALALPEQRYVFVETDFNIQSAGIEFSKEHTDIHGDPVNLDDEYIAAVLTIPVDNSKSDAVLNKSNVLSLKVTNLIFPHTNIITYATLGLNADRIGPGSTDLTIDNVGNLYMGDFGYGYTELLPGYHVIKISTSGSISVFAETDAFPAGSDFDQSGNLLQANRYSGTVIKLNKNGERSEFLDNPEIINTFSGEQNFLPDDILIDGDIMYITDCENKRILKVNEQKEVSLFTVLKSCPKGIIKASDGHFYVSINDASGDILRIDAAGKVDKFTSIPTTIPDNYQLEYQMWLGYLTELDGAIYVAGTSTHRIYKITMNGEVSIFAGSGNKGKIGGSLSYAELNRPNGIVADPDGKAIYISCSSDLERTHTQAAGPARIWKIELTEN